MTRLAKRAALTLSILEESADEDTLSPPSKLDRSLLSGCLGPGSLAPKQWSAVPCPPAQARPISPAQPKTPDQTKPSPPRQPSSACQPSAAQKQKETFQISAKPRTQTLHKSIKFDNVIHIFGTVASPS